MKRAAAFTATALACLLPAPALAQATPEHWSALYGGPILLGGALTVMAIGAAFAFPIWSKLGILLWTLLVTAAGCLAIYTMQGAALGKPWQLPALSAGLLVFVYAGNWALVRLKRA